MLDVTNPKWSLHVTKTNDQIYDLVQTKYIKCSTFDPTIGHEVKKTPAGAKKYNFRQIIFHWNIHFTKLGFIIQIKCDVARNFGYAESILE